MIGGFMRKFVPSREEACEIKVSSEELLKSALEMRGFYDNISRRLKEIENEINNIENYWESDNAQLVLNLFKQEEINSDMLESLFNEQVNDLNQIISLYENVEKSNADIAMTLPNDIFN